MSESNVLRFPVQKARRDREPLVKKGDIARELHVSERWVELRMRDAGLPYIKDAHSRLVYYRLSDVLDWFERRAS